MMGGETGKPQSSLQPPSPNIDLGGGQIGSMKGSFGDTGAGVNFGGDSFKLSGGGNQLSATNTNTGSISSSQDYKPKDALKLQLTNMAQQSANDLVSFRNYGFSPQGGMGEEQPVWQKGYSVNNMYDPMMQQAMQRKQMEAVMRYKQGRSV